jgi:hypothetical protein
MVMDNKHMVDGDGVGDDDGEEALKIPLFGVESRILEPPKMKIAMAAALWVSKILSFWEIRFLGYIKACVKGEAEVATKSQTNLGGMAGLLDCATWSHLQARWPLVSLLLQVLLFHKNFCGIFARIYFHHFLHQKPKKDVFAKNNVRFYKFISYMVRFQSKTMSKGLGKVDVFWIHQTHCSKAFQATCL